MGIFIGLESQAPSVYAEMEDGANIFMDLVADCEAQNIAELDTKIELELIGINNLTEIKNQIKAGELSSVEAVFGPSLEHAGIDISEEYSAIESVMGKIKSGMHRVWEFIMKMVAWVKDFFVKRFGKFKGYAKSLKKRKKDLESDNKGIKILKKASGDNETVSKNTLKWDNVQKVLAAVSKSDLIMKYEDMDNFKLSENDTPWVKVTPDSDEDVTTYEVDDMLDDLLETDRPVKDVVTGVTDTDTDKVKSMKEVKDYISEFDKAIGLANSLSNGKLYQAIQKGINKTSQKIDKEIKKADYSDDEKDNAKTVRNQISAKNKIIKIHLKAAAAAMVTLLAPSVAKTGGNGGGGEGGSDKTAAELKTEYDTALAAFKDNPDDDALKTAANDAYDAYAKKAGDNAVEKDAVLK